MRPKLLHCSAYASLRALRSSCGRVPVFHRPGILGTTAPNIRTHTTTSVQQLNSGRWLAFATGIVGTALLGWRYVLWQQPQPQGPQYASEDVMLKVASEIQAVLGDEAVSFDADDLETHGYSEWSTANTSSRPMAVLRPSTTEDVSLIAKLCNLNKIPLIAYGAGSSVEGNFSAPHSGFTLDISGMDKIIAFREDDMDVTVQAGVCWTDLNESIKDFGLFLPMDPSPTARIGGMIATNCSGTNAMRYGTMKDWVVNLTVVLADGSIIKTKQRPRKSSAGYNLNALFTGSEGTLGIVTEATVKLAPCPKSFGVATATFKTVKDAAFAASKMVRSGIPLAALEMMDDTQMKIINQNGGVGGKRQKELPTLFIKFSGSRGAVLEHVSLVKQMVDAHGGTNFTEALDNTTEQDNLWRARKEALWAFIAVKPEGTEIWSTDVAVPLSRLAEIIDLSKDASFKLGLFSTVMGHVGDGNFHQSVAYDPNDPLQKTAVKKCVDDMAVRAIAMEGTVSGEHGIGMGKKEKLVMELGEQTLGVMRALKQSLDPNWILNPGKVFDPR